LICNIDSFLPLWGGNRVALLVYIVFSLCGEWGAAEGEKILINRKQVSGKIRSEIQTELRE